MIKIFSKPNCPFCVKAKEYLDELELEYAVVDITKDAMGHSFMVGEGHKTVPQLYYGTSLLVAGGYDGLASHTKEQISSLIGDMNVT